MVGGQVVQVVYGLGCNAEGELDESVYVEVLETDEPFARTWRKLPQPGRRVYVGDSIWWQSRRGYLTRAAEFADMPVGACLPAENPKISAKAVIRRLKWRE